MKIKNTPISLALACGLLFSACEEQVYDTPLFKDFTYKSTESWYPNKIDNQKQYLNPIIAGCYPDPSICRKGNDYYLANSSFTYFPGIPIWHSTDLVHWEIINYALNKPSQLFLKSGIRISGGIYAPDIKYNPSNDTFYIIVTGVDCGGNFIVKSKDPAKGWSDPIPVPEVGGIDPSLLFDNDGKAYIVNNDAPSYPAEYDGHRAIWIREYDTKTDKVVGPQQVIIDKGVKPEDKPIWIEGPHLYHINDTYYLMAAEGGTADMHSEVVFHSQSPFGPFTPCKTNPILTQRTLNPDRPMPITCAGHADLIQTQEGNWWAVFLGVLPYDGTKYCNTGRSTFLLPVKWENNQPIILDDGETIPFVASTETLPNADENKNYGPSKSSYITDYSVKFDDNNLDSDWITLRTPTEDWYHSSKDGLYINSRPISLSEKNQPSMLCRWIKNISFTATTTLNYNPQSSQDMAGLACFQSENAYYFIGKTRDENGNETVNLVCQDKSDYKVIAKSEIDASNKHHSLKLKVDALSSTYRFSYSLDGKKWIQLGDDQDGTILSSAYAGGFTGAVIGLYATSANQ